MATLQIEFRDGKFISHNGVNVEVATETHIEGNGWVGDVYENGEFAFLATHFYSGVRHQLKYRIKKGYVKKLLKIGDGRPRVLKSYKMKNWPMDGVIGLSDGFVDERVTYFRDKSFQDFLDESQITAVRCESANGIYRLMSDHNGHAMIFSEEIQTDGISKLIGTDVESDEESKTESFTIWHMMEVTNASWVIKTVWKYGEIKHRILYTLDDPQKIIGLPKVR